MSEPTTPELDKLKKVQETSQRIGEFLEWLQSVKHYVIAEWNHSDEDESDWIKTPREADADEQLQPVTLGSYGIEGLLAEYFNIDLKKVEQEKEAILTRFREKTKEQT
jgi:hypothetical protein